MSQAPDQATKAAAARCGGALSVLQSGEAVQLCRALTPDVVICDQQLPDGSGSDLPARLGQRETRVLLVTGVDSESAFSAAIAGGCAGFVSKTSGLARLVAAVHDLAADRAVFPAGLLGQIATTHPAQVDLTPRELEVLHLLADAASSDEIASSLGVSLHTARNHIRTALAKLGATTRLEAVVTAARQGIVDLSPGSGT